MKIYAPESLISETFRLQPIHKVGLKKLGLETLRDLLLYLPSRYGDKAELKHIDELVNGEMATISARVLKAETKKSFKSHIPMGEMVVEDDTGRLRILWLHQPYLAKKVPVESFAKITGKASVKDGKRTMINPAIEEVAEMGLAHHDSLFADGALPSTPVYSETRGVSSLWFHHKISELLQNKVHEKIHDPIPTEILKKYNLPTLASALVFIHTPKKDSDAEAARKRFAFEEIFYIQLARIKSRKDYEKNPSFKISITDKEIEKFKKLFPFEMTPAQNFAIEKIISDFRGEKPMARLLEGDVGSGKTVVAATASYSIVMTPAKNELGNLQVAYMAPTEILANQHFESFCKYFIPSGISVGLVTGSGCKKFPSKSNPNEATDISKTQLMKWVLSGEIPILIGTHALIQKTVKFKNLGLVIIDEQHRFGIGQRAKLAKKESEAEAISVGRTILKEKDKVCAQKVKCPVPHLLSMTATPIPRTLALTIFGDLDLTLLDQMPSGRKPIITEIVMPAHRQNIYEKIREEISAGRQAYILCPRIDEPDPAKETALIAKSVKAEAERLQKKVFPEFKIGILHGKMKADEKEQVMKNFLNQKNNILVATSIIEVGVNVENATIIVIESGERFGLAQLHQLRGRVIRSNHQSYCYIFTESKSDKTLERLRIIKSAKNGFELAEMDLNLRGIGELEGKKQWGISDIGMEAIRNLKMVEAAREEARIILERDPELKNCPILKQKTTRKSAECHLE